MKLEPTREQVEAIVDVLARPSWTYVEAARDLWRLIAPMALAAAVEECRNVQDRHGVGGRAWAGAAKCEEAIRALMRSSRAEIGTDAGKEGDAK